MASKKKVVRKKKVSRKKKPAARKARRPAKFAKALDRAQKDLPPNLRRMVKQVKKGIRDLERQIEKARADGERRWEKQQDQIRRDAVALLKRLEKAVAPPARRSTTKKSTRKK